MIYKLVILNVFTLTFSFNLLLVYLGIFFYCWRLIVIHLKFLFWTFILLLQISIIQIEWEILNIWIFKRLWGKRWWWIILIRIHLNTYIFTQINYFLNRIIVCIFFLFTFLYYFITHNRFFNLYYFLFLLFFLVINILWLIKWAYNLNPL